MKSLSESSEVNKPGSKITNPEIINNIEQYISEEIGNDVKLTLCKSRIPSRKETLYFFIESQSEVDSFKLSEIGVYIQGKIDFLDVSVQWKNVSKEGIYKRNFIDEVEFNANNKRSIEKFIDRNFPHILSYQKQLKEHGAVFSEFEKMQREETDILGEKVLDLCRREAESHNLTNEDQIASLLSNILKISSEYGFNSEEIVQKVKSNFLVPPVSK